MSNADATTDLYQAVRKTEVEIIAIACLEHGNAKPGRRPNMFWTAAATTDKEAGKAGDCVRHGPAHEA